jgi:hypothetical protein
MTACIDRVFRCRERERERERNISSSPLSYKLWSTTPSPVREMTMMVSKGIEPQKACLV